MEIVAKRLVLAGLLLTSAAARADPVIQGRSLPASARAILKEILTQAELRRVRVTSTDRTARAQARVMLVSIRAKGVAATRKTYGPAGDSVIDAYVAHRKLPRRRLLDRMEAVVRAQVARLNRAAGRGVPRTQLMHVNSDHITFDVAPSSVADRKRFEAAVRANERVVRFLVPGAGERSYHLEIARSAIPPAASSAAAVGPPSLASARPPGS